MLISREREKLIDAIVFFAANTQYSGKESGIAVIQISRCGYGR
jgi:hypothetical protein